MLLVSYIQQCFNTYTYMYFHHSSDKSALKVTDCTVQSAKYWCFYGTVNRGDFGQIFTIFINIFIMMNLILAFIWELVSTRLEHHILYTLNSSWLLHSEIFSVEPCPKSPWSSGWLWTHQHMVFQSNTASRTQNYIVCDLLWTWYKCLTQTASFIIKPVDGRFDCSFFTNSGKFDHLKIDRFLVYFKRTHEKHIRQHIIPTNYSHL